MLTAAAYALEKKPRILIVEDESIIAQDIGAILGELGYAVSGIASSGPAALILAANGDTDLVLMDIRIKGTMDGIQTAGQITQLYQLPVVYLTAHTDDATLKRAQETGPYGFLPKPITAAGIKVTIAIALERRRLQQQAENRAEWLQSALRTAGDAIIISNSEGRVSFVNNAAEELLEIQSDAACGRDVDLVLRIAGQTGLVQRLQNRIVLGEAPEPEVLTAVLLKADGKECRVLMSTASFKDGAGVGRGTIIVVRDISDLLAGEQDLREKTALLAPSNEGLTFLTQSLVHDLKEPLRTISMYSQLIAAEQSDFLAEGTTEYLLGIVDGCSRMSSLISSVMDYTSAVMIDGTPAKLIDAHGPFQEALEKLKPSIIKSEASIEELKLPKVIVHSAALRLIFQNLLSNCLKFSGQNIPRIQVSAVRLDNFWKFTVSDNGMGFDPQQAERIFGLFKKAHSDGPSGSGVGLAICKTLVEQRGGRIWAESQVSGGARFHFTLPADDRRKVSNV